MQSGNIFKSALRSLHKNAKEAASWWSASAPKSHTFSNDKDSFLEIVVLLHFITPNSRLTPLKKVTKVMCQGKSDCVDSNLQNGYRGPSTASMTLPSQLIDPGFPVKSH